MTVDGGRFRQTYYGGAYDSIQNQIWWVNIGRYMVFGSGGLVVALECY